MRHHYEILPMSPHANGLPRVLLFCGLVALAAVAVLTIWLEASPILETFFPGDSSIGDSLKHILPWSSGEEDLDDTDDEEAEAAVQSEDTEENLLLNAADSYEEGEEAAEVEETSEPSQDTLENTLTQLYSPDKQLLGPIYACNENRTRNFTPGTFEHKLLAADCGLGYDYLNSTSKYKPWKVVLYGPGFTNQITGLSGCLLGSGKCPFAPRCQFIESARSADTANADVVVVFQNDANWIDSVIKRKGQYRVLYWREAFYAAPSVGTQRKFDFEMGVHWQAMLLNPQFFRTPAALLGGITYPQKQVIPFLTLEKRTNFAMSVISNCRTASQRNVYIQRLVHYLGPSKVHQFGKCGNMELPPPPIKNAAKIIANYKFYLSFENTIEDGYVTEKLLHVLAMPIIPVYYGSPRTPNITITPSFIKVSDFSHPKKLADYLLYLDANPEKYYEYHKWRTDPKLFHPDYLEAMAMKSPGPNEMLPIRNRGSKFYPRSAACCKLCDEKYVQWAKDNRKDFVTTRMSKSQIERRFFQGDFYGDPKN